MHDDLILVRSSIGFYNRPMPPTKIAGVFAVEGIQSSADGMVCDSC